VRGKGGDIRALADRLQREKGVLHARLSTSTTGRKLR
jgi:metal-responsive CopG/Arc/MetJ family transcriptional regulator